MYYEYLIRRLLQMIPVLLGISILIFILSRVVPGDPVRLALGPEATQEQIEAYRKELGLDQPIHIQYLNYLRGLTHGQLGRSLRTNRDVIKDIRDFFPATFELTTVAMVFAVLVGIPLGITSALHKDAWQDQGTRVLALSGVALPRFWLGILLQLVFAYWLGILPTIGRASQPPQHITGLYLLDSLLTGDARAFWDSLRHIALPAFTLSLATLAQIMRLTRASMIEQMRMEYIQASRAYGLPENLIVYKYMLKNAFTSTLTIIGLTYGFLLGNAFLVEFVFAWPGMARYGAQAVIYKDFNAVVAVTTVVGIAYLLVNFVVDLLYGFLDPRIRLGAR
ncbi:MAG: ABC transporter permease [Chloroflexi bacterium]|nr:ABC transporter permease [Chloroflexota bacterium]